MRRLLTMLFALLGASAQSPETTVGGKYREAFEAWLSAEAQTHWDRRDRVLASLNTRQSILEYQQGIQRTALELIGGLPQEKSPLNAIVTGSFERTGYRVEKLIFESLPGFRVTANLYLPTTGKAPYPAVLGVAGHSNNGKASATYQRAFIGFVQRGIAVLAYDPPGQGERLEYLDLATGKSRAGIGVGEHMMAGVPALLTGMPIARHFVWDGIRAVDYLLSRPEIDARRIGVAGNSGGGTQAAYLAMLEPRLATAISSCYMTSWRELWAGPGPQDSEQVWPDSIARGLDFGDFALSGAPRPFLITSAIRDYFPILGARNTFRQNQRLFDILGGGEKMGFFEFDDTHGWSKPRREAANRWLERVFFGKESEGREADMATEEESLLYATSTGQLASSGGSETMQTMNRKRAAQLELQRPRVTPERIRTALRWHEPAARIAASSIGEVVGTSGRIEKLELLVEGGVRIPALYHFRPESKGHILFVSGAGKAGDPDVDELVGLGYAVLAIDPRGSGESYFGSGSSGYKQSYQTASRAWLIGRNLLEMQAADMVAALRYLKQERGASRVILFAKGNLGPAATIAAALDPGFAGLMLEGSIPSLRLIVDSPIQEGLQNMIAPNALSSFDLPDARQLIAPRPVLVISPISAVGIPDRSIPLDAVPGRHVLRGEGWPLERVANRFLNSGPARPDSTKHGITPGG